MRGYVGELVFFFIDGKAVGLTLYRDWLTQGGIQLEKGIELSSW